MLEYAVFICRMATSIVLVAREKNFTQADTSSLVVAFATSYVKTVLSFVGSKDGPEDTYFGSKTTNGELKDFLQDVEKTMSRKAMLSKWVDADTGKFNTNLPDLQPVSEVLKQRIVDAWPAYMSTTKISDKSFFNIVDIARRVNAGTGSLGKNRFYVLIQGDSKKDGTNRILDVKQGGFPVALSFLNDRDRAEYQSWFPNIASEGARAGIAYRAWCVRVDPTLGSLFMAIDNPQNTTYPPIPWVFGVRERSPWKDTWDYESDGSLKNMNSMVGWWGRILATQHCRTDARYAKGIYVHTLFPESLSQFFSGGNNTDVFIAQVQQVASIYADQVNQDFASFVAHVNDTKMIKTTS